MSWHVRNLPSTAVGRSSRRGFCHAHKHGFLDDLLSYLQDWHVDDLSSPSAVAHALADKTFLKMRSQETKDT